MAYEFNHYYELQNVATGKYVNVLGNHEDGTVKNGETVNLFNRTNNPDQRWALENYGGNGNVRIVLQRGECNTFHYNVTPIMSDLLYRFLIQKAHTPVPLRFSNHPGPNPVSSAALRYAHQPSASESAL